MTKIKSDFSKNWIIENAVEICEQYDKGVLTLRALHYQLVGRGMTNDIKHYKKVVMSMIDARWENVISFDTFSDLDRVMIGNTDYEKTNVEDKASQAKRQVGLWMTSYRKNRWENQDIYPEVFIEKKALQGVFQQKCTEWNVSLGACKGYPSLTFLYEASLRFKEAVSNGKIPVILYFGDYDPSGEDIPRSIQENLNRFGVEVDVQRIALMEHQVIEWQLPPAPAKETDSRTTNWTGLGQVELDAVRPEKLMILCENALENIFNREVYEELLEIESNERVEFKNELKLFVNSLKD